MSWRDEAGACLVALLKSRPNLQVLVHYRHSDTSLDAGVLFEVTQNGNTIRDRVGPCALLYGGGFGPDDVGADVAARILRKLDAAAVTP